MTAERKSVKGGKMALHADKDYPLYEKHPELIRTQTGKGIDEINRDNIIAGKLSAADCRIHPDTLEFQAQIQESFGNPQVAANFRRAAEMTRIPDGRILEIYNCLRPGRSTKEELLAIADELETVWHAEANATLVKEAAEVYEKQGMLR